MRFFLRVYCLMLLGLITPVPLQCRTLTQLKRCNESSHPPLQKLFSVMRRKKSNLVFSCDVTKKSDVLRLVRLVAPEIAVLKIHADIIEEFDLEFIETLRGLATQYDFLLFEDRKFSDIGKISALQYEFGIHRIADWADMVTAHTIAGRGTIDGLFKAGAARGLGILLVAEMSSEGALQSEEYVKTQRTIAERGGILGFISQHKISSRSDLIQMTPGVGRPGQRGILGQQYRTPEEAIESGADLIIVGSGIAEADDPAAEARWFREVAWQAYVNR